MTKKKAISKLKLVANICKRFSRAISDLHTHHVFWNILPGPRFFASDFIYVPWKQYFLENEGVRGLFFQFIMFFNDEYQF